MLQLTQRAPRRNSPRGKQRVQWRGKRADVVRARSRYFSDHVNAYSAQPQQGHIRGHIAKLRPQDSLHLVLYVAERFSRNQQWSRLRQGDAPFAIHCSRNAL